MVLYDIESFMGEFETLVKTNIQTYMTAVSTEKGDSLLPGFDSDSYRLWSISDIPPYQLSFLQFIAGDPFVDVSNPGLDHALSYSVRLTCFVQDTADDNMGKIKARMNRVLLIMFQEKIVPKFTNLNLTISSIDSTLLQSPDGTTYDTSSVMFNVTMAF
jgi:hypothetical protein